MSIEIFEVDDRITVRLFGGEETQEATVIGVFTHRPEGEPEYPGYEVRLADGSEDTISEMVAEITKSDAVPAPAL